jgi:hypothetical protein
MIENYLGVGVYIYIYTSPLPILPPFQSVSLPTQSRKEKKKRGGIPIYLPSF